MSYVTWYSLLFVLTPSRFLHFSQCNFASCFSLFRGLHRIVQFCIMFLIVPWNTQNRTILHHVFHCSVDYTESYNVASCFSLFRGLHRMVQFCIIFFIVPCITQNRIILHHVFHCSVDSIWSLFWFDKLMGRTKLGQLKKLEKPFVKRT